MSEANICSDAENLVEMPKFPSKRLQSKNGQALPCVVCKTNPSKYKFKCCLFGYCSATCFKDHSVCTPVTRELIVRKRFMDPFEHLEIPSEDILSNDQLESLRQDHTVRSFLEHPKVRRIIQRIDSTRDRHAALERHMQTDSSFLAVVNAVAKAVGASLASV